MGGKWLILESTGQIRTSDFDFNPDDYVGVEGVLYTARTIGNYVEHEVAGAANPGRLSVFFNLGLDPDWKFLQVDNGDFYFRKTA